MSHQRDLGVTGRAASSIIDTGFDLRSWLQGDDLYAAPTRLSSSCSATASNACAAFANVP
jgi:hypothetical protein